jgi:hypothetical protein
MLKLWEAACPSLPSFLTGILSFSLALLPWRQNGPRHAVNIPRPAPLNLSYSLGKSFRYSKKHTGNQSESVETVPRIEEFVGQLIGEGTTCTDKNGKTRQLRLKDILVVALSNAHASLLTEKLPTGARVEP